MDKHGIRQQIFKSSESIHNPNRAKPDSRLYARAAASSYTGNLPSNRGVQRTTPPGVGDGTTDRVSLNQHVIG